MRVGYDLRKESKGQRLQRRKDFINFNATLKRELANVEKYICIVYMQVYIYKKNTRIATYS